MNRHDPEPKTVSEQPAERETASIRYNVPKIHEADEANFTLHAGAVTVFFDDIRETHAGYRFQKDGTEVAFIAKPDCDVAPSAAKNYAEDHPGEKVPFKD